MHKLVTFFSVAILFSIIVSAQPTVDIPLSGSDGTLTIPLAVGLDASATNGIDPGLGESDLPPFPPLGAFEIRFDLTPYAGEPLSTYKDYRNAAAFPYSGQKIHRLIWQLSAPGLPLNITYNLPAEANMILTDEFGGVLFNSGTLTGSGTYAIVVGVTSALLTMNYMAIPVELTSFTGNVHGNGVLLKWTTATELNNQGFEIEKSTSLQTWEKIGYVPGYGTTTEPKAYTFMDNNVVNGTNYYRLKQIDFDGTSTYSETIEVEVDLTVNSFSLGQNYPNPFNPSTTIQFQIPEVSDVSIIIYDMVGQEVRTLFAGQVQAGKYSVEWDGLNNSGMRMSSGGYIYRMTAGDFVDVKEMILLK